MTPVPPAVYSLLYWNTFTDWLIIAGIVFVVILGMGLLDGVLLPPWTSRSSVFTSLYVAAFLFALGLGHFLSCGMAEEGTLILSHPFTASPVADSPDSYDLAWTEHRAPVELPSGQVPLLDKLHRVTLSEYDLDRLAHAWSLADAATAPKGLTAFARQ